MQRRMEETDTVSAVQPTCINLFGVWFYIIGKNITTTKTPNASFVFVNKTTGVQCHTLCVIVERMLVFCRQEFFIRTRQYFLDNGIIMAIIIVYRPCSHCLFSSSSSSSLSLLLTAASCFLKLPLLGPTYNMSSKDHTHVLSCCLVVYL